METTSSSLPPCPQCTAPARKFGKDNRGQQRFHCNPCNKTFIVDKKEMRLEKSKAILCLKLLVEGNSVRSTERITTVNRNTILHLIEVVGTRCEEVIEQYVREIPMGNVEADEIWGFVGKKEGHKKEEEKNNAQIGDAYTFVAIEAKSKLVVCYALGRRDFETAKKFTDKLQKVASSRFQLTTDGLRAYLDAVEQTFGIDIDFAQLVKKYKSDESRKIERRYSPGDFVSAVKVPVTGNPVMETVSTSYVERQNLTMRMSMRRLTRLTNGFSKKWENMEKALAIHFAYYNFCRIHQSLRVTPAMEAGITNHVWTLDELLGATFY
jgi:transposase-like protein/IS1 family transposase